MTLLPVEPAWRLAASAAELRWLITDLWSHEAVGIVGGEPKCCKSFLALDLAIAVAAGVPCLRRFAVPDPGRVLLYAAEDSPAIVRRRLEGIAAAAGVDLPDVDILVITALSLRLDLEADRRSLADTVATLKPRLLILDSFVRLHRIDENASAEVAPLLAYLRELQRRHGLAVLIVHHAKKGGGRTRAGQALRGSSEFRAWGDSNLYLRREGDHLTLTVEHRAAASPKPMRLELAQTGEALALKVVDHCEPAAPVPRSLDERITAALANARGTLPFAELRFHCRVPAATLYTACRARCRRPRHQGTRWLSPRSLTAAIPAIVNARKAGRSQVPASRASYNLRERNWEVRAHFIPAQRGSFSWLSSKRRRRVAPPQASNLSVFWPFQPGNRFN